MKNLYHHPHPFRLESGEILPQLTIAYDTFGTLSPERDNVIWVCHALTANSDVADWWPHTVEQGRFLDPDKYFTVCANFIGSPYGTTSPIDVNPDTGARWLYDFPRFTIRDMVHAHQLLAKHLGITRLHLLIGSSIGGFQALEWCVMQPDITRNAAFIATTPRTAPWAAAFNESQRMAIETDPTWGRTDLENPGAEGMAVARSIALLSYRGQSAYDATQEETDHDPLNVSFTRRAHSYQRYQGDKLRRRFNAVSYYRITQAVDSHNLARGRGPLEDVLASIKAKTLIVSISSDILFPPSDHDIMVRCIPGAEYHIIESQFGHDGFLVEYQKLDNIIRNFLADS